MRRRNRWMVLAVVLIMAGMQLAACGQAPASSANKTKPATVEKVEGTQYNRVVLTEKAAQRLNIQTDTIREEQVNGSSRKVIPYAAVIYGLNGETWTYTSSDPLVFTRQAITVDYIEADKAVLVDGPPAGTPVVTVGVAELYGVDTGIGK